MAKTRDVPNSIREFNKIFEEIAYHHDWGRVFSDYLDYCIECFLPEKDGKLLERLKQTYGKRYLFPQMFHAHMEATKNEIGDNDSDWYDLLGTFYEVILSSSKASVFGQFFTPKPICDFMQAILQPDTDAGDTRKTGFRVNDPACGSGRTLLAFHCKNLGNYLYADDLDPMCTKMAAINMCIHGAVGQACNMNSLDPEDWRFGYNVNPSLYPYGLLSIEPITKEQSYSWNNWEKRKREVEVQQHNNNESNRSAKPKQTTEPQAKTDTEPISNPMPKLGSQLTFF